MAPKKKHQQPVNKHKPITNGHKQEVTNTINTIQPHTTTTAYADDPSLQQLSQPYVDTSTHYSMTNTQPQPSIHETFQLNAQPWTQEIHVSNTSGNTNGSTPMERWQNEGAHEQPWHAIGGVSSYDEGNMGEDQRDIDLDDGGYDGKVGLEYSTA